MEKEVKILLVGSTLGILVLLVVFYSPVLEYTCESWSYSLYNKYNTLNAQFESLYKTGPEDASNKWMNYQRELYGYYGLCYIFV
jgi:hypothetical protein